MAVQLRDVLTAARNRHRAFHKNRIPDVVVASHLSDVQRVLITRGADLDANRVAIQCSIAFATQPGNVPGVVGAGSGGGLPVEAGGTLADLADADTGVAVELDTVGAPVLLADMVPTSATATTLSVSTAAWAVNQFASQVVRITAGTGYGQVRSILSNTATQLTVDGAWAVIPDTTSVFEVLGAHLAASATMSVVTELPPKRTQHGYLVSLDAQGRPFVNLVAPIEVVIDAGIPLPPYERVLGGSVRFKSGTPLCPLSSPLTIRAYRDRYVWGPGYTCWLENEQLFLVGTMQDWADAVSVDLRLVPVPGDFVALTDYFVLPDLAQPVLVAEAAWFMAMRCQGMPDAPAVAMDTFNEGRDRANEHFLQAVGATPRAQVGYVREVWGVAALLVAGLGRLLG